MNVRIVAVIGMFGVACGSGSSDPATGNTGSSGAGGAAGSAGGSAGGAAGATPNLTLMQCAPLCSAFQEAECGGDGPEACVNLCMSVSGWCPEWAALRTCSGEGPFGVQCVGGKTTVTGCASEWTTAMNACLSAAGLCKNGTTVDCQCKDGSPGKDFCAGGKQTGCECG